MANEDLDQDYKEAGFGGELGFGNRPSLVLVDFMMAYFDKASPLYAGVEAELEQAKILLGAARSAGIPIIFTRVEYTDPSQAANFRRKIPALNALTKDSAAGAIHEDVKPNDNELVMTKHYASAFFGTDLAGVLNEAKCDSLIICGLTTSGCIRATGLDALQYGFIPVIAEDACGDRDRRVHEANIFDLGAKYAEITNVDILCNFLKSQKS